MNCSEKYVQALLLNEYGIFLKKIDENIGQGIKTPDFEYEQDNECKFVCELKEIESLKLPEDTNKDTGWEKSIMGGYSKNQNQFNKISDLIYNAYLQMESYNYPKVLLILNHHIGYIIQDLESTIRGYISYDFHGKEIRDFYCRPASLGKIKHKKYMIDLYIWIDAFDKKTDQKEDIFYFRYTTVAGKSLFNKYFQTPIIP